MKSLRPFALVLVLASTPLAHAATLRLGTDVAPVAQNVQLTVDPREDAYFGATRIEVEVKKATPMFRIHAEELTIQAMTLKQGDRAIEVTHAKGEEGTVNVTAKETLQPGRYTLAMDFTNNFNRQAVGLYKMLTRAGEPYLFTQFEAIDARRAFPCFDEPGWKIPFELTVTIPALYDAISNTLVAAETKSGESKTIRFARTKPLPTYLIALAVGQFDYTPIIGMSVPGRIIAPKGQGKLAAYAAEITPPMLAALEKYFGSKYPFEKIDVLGVPEYWAGAMENPGAITFRETILLLDPATATPTQKQALIQIMTHELAHMWFGDLVTMEWWDDFWLNESFADWLGDKITDQVHPELQHGISEMQSIQNVMTADMRATTDAIRKRDQSPIDAMRNVGVAYNKGKAVLSMVESWIGPEKFRQGVLDHIKSNAWGNADTAEFFASLSRHAPAGTAAALETFLTQPGIPLINVELTGPNTLRLTQSRFSASEIAAQTWKVPVTIRYSDGTTTRTAAILLDTPSKIVQLEGKQVAWLYPHANAAGYYRWRMPEAAMSALASRAPELLDARERLALIGNLDALFRAGTMGGDEYLDLIGRFAGDSEPHVIQTLMAALNAVRTTFDSAENRPRFAAYLRRTLGPALNRIGFTPKDGESQQITTLRAQLVGLLAEWGNDEAVWQFAKESLAKYLKDPKSVHPSLATTIVNLGAAHGDAALLEEYRKRFESAATPADRTRFLSGMSNFREPALRRKVRDYALTDAVRANELFTVVGGADTAEERDELFQWVTENYEAIVKRLPPAFAGAMPFVANGCEPARVQRAREFFATRKTEGTERQLARVAEQVRECATLREQQMAAVTRYLEAR